MKKEWIHLNNFFLTRTANRNRLSVRISKKHDAALQVSANEGLAFFTGLYNTYHPIHLTLVSAYDKWLAQNGSQLGNTMNLVQLLKYLSGTKAEDWMVQVKAVYKKTTPQFKALFPALKKPFQTGSQQQRIDAVRALSLSIGDDAALTDIKTDIDSFYDSLNSAHSAQKGSLTSTANHSNAVEAARIQSGIAQFANYGALIQKYAANPEQVGNYFDKSALRQNQQVLFQHQVKKNCVDLLAKYTASPEEKFLLENNGDVPLTFGFVFHKKDEPGEVSVTVAPQTNETVTASQLSDDLLTHHYLVCYNKDENVDGLFTVEIL